MNHHLQKTRLSHASKIGLLIIILSSVISGCALTPPKHLLLPENTASVPLNLPITKENTGKTVRWGGTIVEVKNNKQDTHITILGYPLDSRARPKTYINSLNRFIAIFPSFVEPANYSTGREITVIGSITELQENKIGDYTYNYPVVKVTSHQLWHFRTAANNNAYYAPISYGSYYGSYYGSILTPYYPSLYYPYYSRFGHHRHYAH